MPLIPSRLKKVDRTMENVSVYYQAVYLPKPRHV